jgi:hypothetical protein
MKHDPVTLMDDARARLSDLNEWKDGLAADLGRVAVRDRWGLALIATGWLHLAVFLGCQILVSLDLLGGGPYLALWSIELLGMFVIFRRVAGRGWAYRTPLAGVVLRIWVTFLILAFNAMALNNLTGWSLVWFKPVWATLSSFGFAAMAWLVNPWFLLVAVQMYLTGLLMAMNNATGYAVYAVSWWGALQAIGLVLEWRRKTGNVHRRLDGPRLARETVASATGDGYESAR